MAEPLYTTGPTAVISPVVNRDTRSIIHKPLSLVIGLLSSALLMPGCTGGSSGGSTSISSDSGEGVDPVVLAIPIAYVRRPLPELPMDAPDLRRPNDFAEGAELIVRAQSSVSAEELHINDRIAAIVAEEEGVAADELAIDIKDLNTSYDGGTLIFAARVVPLPVNTNLEFTSWNLWQYDFASGQVDYLMPSRLLRNEGVENGGAQDTAPHFLTDDRIVFSSTRQFTTQSKQLNDGRSQIYAALDEDRNSPASLLHILDPDSDIDQIEQISYNQSHDLAPVVRSSGEIVFSRWNNSGGNSQISLYQINPDGSQLSRLYGQYSGDSGSESSQVHFSQARELADGRLAAILRSADSVSLGGDLVLIDSDNYVDYDQGLWSNLDGTGPGQQSVSAQQVRTDELRSAGGQYTDFYPLDDDSGRLLISWSPCRIMVGGTPTPCNIAPAATDDEELAPPLYGIWLLDPTEGTQSPVVIAREGFVIDEIAAGNPRDFPALAPELADFRSDLALENKGMLLIDSVYDIDSIDASIAGIANLADPGNSAFASRPARFVRIVKPVPIPDDEIFEVPNYAFGVNASQSMREIVGYGVIEPDGSVAVAVPADTPFSISILDAQGRRISERHDNWLQVAAGEVLHCSGCHSGNSALPHGRIDSQAPSANPGARDIGSRLGFPNTRPGLPASELGQTMAEVWLLHGATRELALGPVFTNSDEWSATDEANIDLRYPLDWTDDNEVAEDTAVDDISGERSVVVKNFDLTLDSRIVINYVDHIQPIWDRKRSVIGQPDPTSCVDCHQSAAGRVPYGQLDLSASATDQQPPEHLRSYHELLRRDTRQMLDAGSVVIERRRSCTSTGPNGLLLTTVEDVTVASTLSANGASNSSRFFNCFTGEGNCGRADDPVPSLPANCNETAGTIVAATTGAQDHAGMLSGAELRLIAEWLDIGAQYYNNPFDERLAP